MENKTINLYANNQTLVIDKIIEIVSDTENYIYANVDLGENWEFDSVRAIWSHGIDVPMVISNGRCKVPADVIADVGVVKVNLVGSNVENGVLVDRLTTEQIPTILVKQNVPIDGTDPQEITPSQFEQFVEAVKADAESASESAESASASAESASASAESAHDDKIEIEQKIADVIQQIEDFEQVEVVVNTLPAGSQATSDFTDGVLTLGIPQGAKGDTGNGIASCVLNADYTLTINFTDGTSYITTSIRGAQGVKGDTGNGISSITKTGSETVDGRVVDTYTTTFTDGETTEFEVTNGKDGEVTMSQLSSLLPTDTASGDIASFPDGTDLFPALSVKAEIEPIQDLHGYDKPWAGGAGKNILPITLSDGTASGLNYTVLKDNGGNVLGINLQGTPTANVVEIEVGSVTLTEDVGYKINGCSYPNSDLRIQLKKRGSSTALAQIYNGRDAGYTPTETAEFFITFVVALNGQNVNQTIYPMIRLATITDNTYEPYSNICPISGHTECDVEAVGKNLFDIGELVELGTGVSEITNGYRFNVSSAMFNPGVALQKPLTNPVTISMDVANISGKNLRVRVVNIDGTENEPVGSGTGDGGRVEYTTVKPIKGIKFNWSTTGIFEVTNFQMEFGSTATSYEPYQGDTYTTDLGRTVYGGTLDVVSGELVVDRAYLVSPTVTSVGTSSSGVRYADILSPNSRYDAVGVSSSYAWINQDTAGADGTFRTYTSAITVYDNRFTSKETAQELLTDVQFVYKLATPQTYQLDPTEVDLLLGQNNLWTDCGSVEVTYKADIERWVNKKINALI